MVQGILPPPYPHPLIPSSPSGEEATDHEWYKEFSQCLELLSIVYTALVQDTSPTTRSVFQEEEEEDGVVVDLAQCFNSSRITTRLMQQVF